MNPSSDPYSPNIIFKWDPRCPLPTPSPPPPPPPPPQEPQRPRDLTDVFQGYGVRYLTAVHIGELGFTPSTLAGMRDEELDDMMATMSHLFRWDLLVGERYGIKAAVRAERRRMEVASLGGEGRRLRLLTPPEHLHMDALSQEGLSEEQVQHELEAAGSGGEAGTGADKGKHLQSRRTSTSKKNPNPKSKKKPKTKDKTQVNNDYDYDSDSDPGSGSDGSAVGYGFVSERQREHPFIVTEPGEVARAKKNGLDYLFHLYVQCAELLAQVQAQAKEKGDKCPTKVTNQVFRYAKRVGAHYINKPKMRHYVHCYALHCLDEAVSDSLRREYKQRGENVGSWRQACYQPLVAIAARHGWDIDAVFSANRRLSIWYVPTKLRQMCHLARNNANVAASSVVGSADVHVAQLSLPSLF